DRAPGRRVITRRRQAERTVARAKWDDGLHRSFAEGARADQGRALMILQRAGDDLRRRSRTAIDQNDQRLALGHVARPRIEALRLFRIAAPGRNDLALLQERVGNRNRLIEQATGIVTQIDDIALDLVGAELGVEVVDRLLEPVGGLFVELSDANVADVATFRMPAHRFDANDVAHDRDLDRLVGAFAHDRELDLG